MFCLNWTSQRDSRLDFSGVGDLNARQRANICRGQSSGERIETRSVVPPAGAFTRTVPIRFSHCDPAGIVYFPHYFDMFNGLIKDWYTEQLGVNYANLILGDQHGFPYVHIETDFKLPSRMGERLDLTLLLTRWGGHRSALSSWGMSMASSGCAPAW